MERVAAAALQLRRPFLQSINPRQLLSSFSFPSPGSYRRGRHRALRPLGPSIAEADDSGGFGSDSDSGSARDSGAISRSGGPAKKSRNELKREARRAVRWGMELSKFSVPQIKRVLRAASLEREVFDALMLAKKFGPDVREGKRRQFNYIGRLLRSAQPELMDTLIQASKEGDNSKLFALSGEDILSSEDDEDDVVEDIVYEEEGNEEYLKVASIWFDGLIGKDPSITNEVYAIHNVEFDRQELRKLVRRVHLMQEGELVNGGGGESNAKLSRAKKLLMDFLCSLARKASDE